MNRQKNIENLKKMTGVAMFAALAYVCTLILRIPGIGGFLTMDLKDFIIAIAGMFFGPPAAIVLSILVPLLELPLPASEGFYGFIMNVISSFTFSFTASMIYKYKKTFAGAIIGLLTAVFTVTAVMMLANLIITPYYMKMSVSDVAAFIPKLLLPFNAIKALLNASLTMLFYKPITLILRKNDLFGKKENKANAEKTADEKRKDVVRTIILAVVSVLIAIASLLVIVFVWNGEISFFEAFKK